MTCKNCNGKGHVLSGAKALLAVISVFGLPLILFESNDSQGHTRDRCEVCKGKGYILLPAKDD